ncbi:hypothetical protein J2T02_001950 [Chitinophaga terrae (ex Kim and Jung 2007)]|uniref:hypothetical protein n=1 Tax=Chitinophaga terrae (ex Kim and Jung 2007) TaxID=408074 RepID=UPI002789F518|nr:hypothetical protein [Chitinophaga terrae (ex Kim and Jung 2007)]MDQ0106837.1 hypothetical protein [Chitinophaga terrae (ex Kim and Jung 2007)]
MKYLLLSLLSLTLSLGTIAQSTDEEMKTKEVNDSILQARNLVVPGTFNAERALIQLFPGRFYQRDKKLVINWTCSSCKAIAYEDANGDMTDPKFPFENGVATRLINEMDFRDASGKAYKVISFNHSEFDADGLQMVRFQGGVLGLAKFVLTDEGWKLRMFTPVIGGFGSFSQAPAPKPLQIGEDQYAFVVRHSNGAGGDAYYATSYLVAGINGVYKVIMSAPDVEKTNDPASGWTYSIATDGDKKQFRDIVITIKGTWVQDDAEVLPKELLPLIKGKAKGQFTAIQKFVYNGRYYTQQGAATVSVK